MRSTRRLASGLVWSTVVGGLCAAAAQAPPPGGAPLATATVTVRADSPGAAIPATLFGIFFEDINFAADGGIYAERIKNRSFEFPDPLMGWKRAASDGSRGAFTTGTRTPPSAANPHYLRITSTAGTYGVTNDGFRGIGIRKGDRYRFSVLARRPNVGATSVGATNDTPVTLRVEFENTGNRALGGVTLTGFTRQWQRYTGTIVAEAMEPRARLRLLVSAASSDAGASTATAARAATSGAATSGAGRSAPAANAAAPAILDVDMVSLFPEDTWEGRENGLRRDLVQLLKDLQPGFLRFPGGCIVEGRFLDGRYQWKTTIGAPADRRLIVNRWNDEFPHRATPDYYQSFGLGFFEYFQLAEDLGAEPLPILNCGMACQFNSSELAPLEAIDEYVQDALDLIEFANGPVTSVWGKRRAAMGHPEPFHLKFIGVGNEQWGPQYIERYELFAKVLKTRHPEIRLVSSAGPSAAGERFDLLWRRLRELNADLVDEHYYMPPNWFLTNAQRYDTYPRTGPKVFAGEFAAHLPTVPARAQRPSTLAAAIAEAAFMTGLERNADVVELSSYAPLFAHVDAWQWTPNLIWFDNLRSFGTPSYYVQKLFGTNRGTQVLPVAIDGAAATGQDGLFASASLDARTREAIVKLVNPAASPRSVRLDLSSRAVAGTGRALVLTGDPNAENSLDTPSAIAPREEPVTLTSGRVERTLPAQSLTVLRIAVQ